MKTFKIASICANTQPVSRTKTLVGKISEKIGAALSAQLDQFALADFTDALRTTPYRTALAGEAKAALNAIESADALIVGAPATRLGSCPSIFLHLLELSDPDRLCGKPAVFVTVGSAGVAPRLVKLQLRLLARIIGLRLVSTIFVTKTQLRKYLDDEETSEQVAGAVRALRRTLGGFSEDAGLSSHSSSDRVAEASQAAFANEGAHSLSRCKRQSLLRLWRRQALNSSEF